MIKVEVTQKKDIAKVIQKREIVVDPEEKNLEILVKNIQGLIQKNAIALVQKNIDLVLIKKKRIRKNLPIDHTVVKKAQL